MKIEPDHSQWMGACFAPSSIAIVRSTRPRDARRRPVLTKAQVLENLFGGPESPLASARIDDIELRVFGESAVVAGRTTATDRVGQTFSLRFTDLIGMGSGSSCRRKLPRSNGERSGRETLERGPVAPR